MEWHFNLLNTCMEIEVQIPGFLKKAEGKIVWAEGKVVMGYFQFSGSYLECHGLASGKVLFFFFFMKLLNCNTLILRI